MKKRILYAFIAITVLLMSTPTSRASNENAPLGINDKIEPGLANRIANSKNDTLFWIEIQRLDTSRLQTLWDGEDILKEIDTIFFLEDDYVAAFVEARRDEFDEFNVPAVYEMENTWSVEFNFVHAAKNRDWRSAFLENHYNHERGTPTEYHQRIIVQATRAEIYRYASLDEVAHITWAWYGYLKHGATCCNQNPCYLDFDSWADTGSWWKNPTQTVVEPSSVVAHEVTEEVCFDCGVEHRWRVSRVICPDTDEILVERRVATKRDSQGRLRERCMGSFSLR